MKFLAGSLAAIESIKAAKVVSTLAVTNLWLYTWKISSDTCLNAGSSNAFAKEVSPFVEMSTD